MMKKFYAVLALVAVAGLLSPVYAQEAAAAACLLGVRRRGPPVVPTGAAVRAYAAAWACAGESPCACSSS